MKKFLFHTYIEQDGFLNGSWNAYLFQFIIPFVERLHTCHGVLAREGDVPVGKRVLHYSTSMCGRRLSRKLVLVHRCTP